MIAKVMERVESQLKHDPKSRDSDSYLMAQLWIQDCILGDADLGDLTISFLANYSQGRFTNPASIVRARRILQRRFPELRGERYEERNVKLNNEVKNEVKQIESDFDNDQHLGCHSANG